MRLARVEAYRIRIPFRGAFGHASAERALAENLVVRCTAADGTTGWGETIAREYVTGETTDGVLARWRAAGPVPWRADFDGVPDVTRALDAASLAHAARCGPELALLDLLARRRGLRLSELLAADLPELARVRIRPPYRYSGVLGLGAPRQTLVRAAKLRVFGFRSVKIKVAGRLEDDRRRLRLARRVLGRRVALRVDANESWDLGHAWDMAPALQAARVEAVEQPFPKGADDATCEFSRRTGLHVILDESLCSPDDARRALGFGIPVQFAVKLAKLGGFVPTLRVLALAEAAAVPIQISCQVGESALLSAAGRQLATLCPGLRALEGSFDRFLLTDNVIAGHVGFGWGGRAGDLPGAGLGIVVDPARVERLAVEREVLYGDA